MDLSSEAFSYGALQKERQKEQEDLAQNLRQSKVTQHKTQCANILGREIGKGRYGSVRENALKKEASVIKTVSRFEYTNGGRKFTEDLAQNARDGRNMFRFEQEVA